MRAALLALLIATGHGNAAAQAADGAAGVRNATRADAVARLHRTDADTLLIADAAHPARKPAHDPDRQLAAASTTAPPESAPMPGAGPLGAISGALVAVVAASGYAALFGTAPSAGVAFVIVALAVLLLAGALASVVAATRERRPAYAGLPEAQRLRDLGPITIGLLGREGEAEPFVARLAPEPATVAGATPRATSAPVAPTAPASIAPVPALAPVRLPHMPAGFDGAGFLTAAREHFLRLQQAWDAGDMAGMESVMTAAMVGRVHDELERRQAERGRAERNEILDLHAELLGVETVDGEWTASVRFKGRMRDLDATVASETADGFDEVWNFDCADRIENRWLLAGIESLTA